MRKKPAKSETTPVSCEPVPTGTLADQTNLEAACIDRTVMAPMPTRDNLDHPDPRTWDCLIGRVRVWPEDSAEQGIELAAIYDTGATATIISRKVAKVLGLNLRKGGRTVISTGNGTFTGRMQMLVVQAQDGPAFPTIVVIVPDSPAPACGCEMILGMTYMIPAGAVIQCGERKVTYRVPTQRATKMWARIFSDMNKPTELSASTDP